MPSWGPQVQAKKRENADRLNFKIEGAEQLKTMRAVQSPTAVGLQDISEGPSAP